MFQHSTYPKAWALGIISPIHKKGSPYISDNYRGITVTNTLSKVFGIIMNTRLKAFCEQHSIINDRQSSHKDGTRTVDNVLIIKSLFEKYCMKGKTKLYASFIDFRKAFDSIWHEGLFLKLLQHQIGGPFYDLLKKMYSMNKSLVKINRTFTTEFPIASGVRQGDILSPLLFNIFINDIIGEFQGSLSQAPKLINQEVGGLLYADDLVILSTTQEGLQHSINKLDQYCRKWKLHVNLTKSKLMCLSKSRKMHQFEAKYGDIKLEQVQSYPYLGVELMWNGSMKRAEELMTMKAQKAMFKLRSLLQGSNIRPSTSLQLFDQLIKPICLYGSEIWAIDTIKYTSSDALAKSLESLASEKLNISFSKCTLGVHRKAQNTAVRGELGRLPLGIDAVANAILYYTHIENDSTNPLLREAWEMNRFKVKECWSHKLDHFITYIKNTNNYNGLEINRRNIKSTLKAIYEEHWLTKMSTENKMRTYRQLKTNFRYEQYLDIVNSQHRKSLTRLRISAHNLAIERGRYTRPPTILEERTCPTCPQYIQDEFHFLMKCQQHTNARNDLLNRITELCPMLKYVTPYTQFLFMLTSEGDIIKEVSQFIHKCLP